MRVLKLLIISVVILFLLIMAFSALLPSQIRISRAVDILTPYETVRMKLINLEQWEQWNEFIKVLPEKHVTGDSIISKPLIVSLKNNASFVVTRWVQQNGKSFPAVFNIISQDSVTTTLQWYFDFKFKWYPWEKFSSIIYDKQLGPQMEQSLLSLKEMLEKAS